MKCGNALHKVNGGFKNNVHKIQRTQSVVTDIITPKYRRKEIYGQQEMISKKKINVYKIGGNNRSRGMSGSHSYADKYPTAYSVTQFTEYLKENLYC